MRKIISFGTTVLLFFVVFVSSAKSQEVKDYFRGMPIDKIEVAGNFNVTIKHSEDTHLKLSSSETDKIEVSCKSGVLKMDCKNSRGATAVIYVHNKVKEISLKKGATLTSDEVLTFKKIKIEMSDATIKDMQMKGDAATFSTKGSTISGVTLNIEKVSADFGKSSSFVGVIPNAKEIKIASNSKTTVDVKGKTKKLNINATNTTVNAAELEAGTVETKLQDNAVVSVYATDQLNVAMKTAATLKHRGSAKMIVKKLAEGGVITNE